MAPDTKPAGKGPLPGYWIYKPFLAGRACHCQGGHGHPHVPTTFLRSPSSRMRSKHLAQRLAAAPENEQPRGEGAASKYARHWKCQQEFPKV